MRWLALVAMIVVGAVVAYQSSSVRPLSSLSAAVATVGLYILLFRRDLWR